MRFEHIESYQNDALKNTHQKISYNAPLPALSVLYHLTDSWNLYANTEGSFGTVQYSQIGKAVISGSVEPEKARTWETGTRYDDGYLSAEAGIFLINFNNQYDSNQIDDSVTARGKPVIVVWKRSSAMIYPPCHRTWRIYRSMPAMLM